MSVSLALGLFLLGVSVGGLLVIIQQTSLRRRFAASIADELDRALFGKLRRDRNSLTHTSAKATERKGTDSLTPNVSEAFLCRESASTFGTRFHCTGRDVESIRVS